MAALGALSVLNILVLLAPPQIISDILTLMPIPDRGRLFLLLVVVVNVVASHLFEKWGAEKVGTFFGKIASWHGRRSLDGKMYKVLEGGMD